MKNKRSHRDSIEITQHEHEEEFDAKRVYVVNGEQVKFDIDADKIAESLNEALKKVNFQMEKQEPSIISVPEIKIVEIEKQVFVPQIETKIVEVPVITKEIQVITVEKPIITEVIKAIEIEKPLIIEKTLEKIPAWCWSLIFSQTIAVSILVWQLLQRGV